MNCYKTLFTKDGIITNYGNYILIFLNTTFYILGICFYKFGYPLLNDKIMEIKEKKFEEGQNNINKNETIGEKELDNPIKKKKGKNPKFSKNQNKTKNKAKNININKIFRNKKVKKKFKKKSKKNKVTNNNFPESNKNKSFSNIDLRTNRILKIKGTDKKTTKEKTPILNDHELNTLSYALALKYDKRSLCQYYTSLLRAKHPFLFAFCPMNDYNSIIIKISIFLLFFSVNYAINRAFFNESTIHKIYEDEGIYNFIYLVPQIVYSFVISHTFYILMRYFFLSEKSIVEIKNETNEDALYEKENDIKKCLVIKYICLYVFGSLLLIFFWYYISSFGAVYKNTQLYLMKNALISFSFTLVYPFFINFIPAVFRILSLDNGEKNKKECLFKISKFMQII